MSHPSRGPASVGIDGKANAAKRRLLEPEGKAGR
jgi:hypothetical protein